MYLLIITATSPSSLSSIKDPQNTSSIQTPPKTIAELNQNSSNFFNEHNYQRQNQNFENYRQVETGPTWQPVDQPVTNKVKLCLNISKKISASFLLDVRVDFDVFLPCL